MSKRFNYVLITPAKNEAQFIELTLKSVVAQTHLPLKWVIVSDGSTDGTDDIITKYLSLHPWIELLRMPPRQERHFAGKVLAFREGYARVAGIDYQVIGNLDGDVSFEDDYFEFLLEKFEQNPRLGVAGTPFREGTFQYDYRFTSIEHVSGQAQLFRRECFEQIGGYVPRKIGGVDLVAVISARMKGWETRTFLEKPYNHHRQMGTATQNPLRVPYRVGRADYILGSHPLWELSRCVYQMKGHPVVLGGLLRLAGFMWAMITCVEKQVPFELIRFRRREQMKRLRHFVMNLCNLSLPLTSPQHTKQRN
jgi:glycosyltransferase involved in cell wall biosynthesis